MYNSFLSFKQVMINKKVISDIVSKYSLGNNIEKVKWVVIDDKFTINFINDSDDWSVSFSVSDEFITRFVKSKDALSDLDTFTVETRDGFNGEELVFTVGTNITNTIEFTVENATINESFEAVPFDSILLKEILKANRTYHSGEIRINKKGLLDAHLHHGDDLYTGYYLVRKQENN